MPLTLVSSAVGSYRNHKVHTLQNTPQYLKPYVEQYFNKADKHFERLMDIVVNIPNTFNIEHDDTTIVVTQDKLSFVLRLSPELTDADMMESEFLLSLVKRTRLGV